MSNLKRDSKRRHVFISHHHKDDAEVDKLMRLLSRKGYDIRNSSIRAGPANQARLDKGLVKPEVIRRLLRMKISWAGTVVVLVGRETHSRRWVDWEIKQAQKQNKRIVGVWAQGSTEADLPKNLEKYADALVGWKSDRIIDAIDGKPDNDDWQKPDGTAWPKRDITRVMCQ